MNTEKIFPGGRGCVSLQRGVPGRGEGSDGGRRKLSGSERSTSVIYKTGVWNRHFAGWHRDG